MIAIGTCGGCLSLVDSTTGVTRWEVQNDYHPDNNQNLFRPHYQCAAMSPDGRCVASVNNHEENWKLFDAASGVVCMTGARHDGTGDCMCQVTRSGLRKSLDKKCPVRAHTSVLVAVAFSPCGQRLATGGMDRVVLLWNAQTGKAEHLMPRHTGRVVSVSFSAKGERLASGSWDHSICVWDTQTGALLRTIPQAHTDYMSRVHFSPTDSRRLVSSGIVGIKMKLWDVDSGELLTDFDGNRFAVFSPNGRTIATGHPSQYVELTNPESITRYTANDFILVDAFTGELRLRMVGHTRPVITAFFSPDGSKLASGSADGTCRVWDSSTGEILSTIQLLSEANFIWSISWGRDWLLETQQAMAFAMGHHPRLGVGSQVLGLDEELLRMILDRE